MLLMAPQIFFVFALTLLLGVASATDVLGAVEFAYSGKNGPDKWGSLDPAFAACSSGNKQSPINIQKNQTVHNKLLKPLIRNYKPANSTLVNNGFNIGVRFDEYAGEVTIDGKTYSLRQMHWHLPSEHHINGEQFAAELHLVHRAADNSVAVVALLYQEEDADPVISKIMNGLNNLAKEKCKADEVAEIPLGTLDIKPLKRSSRKYYRYAGSLTTPPCSENVTWSILGKVRSISKEQIAALEASVNSNCKKNARPCQRLNGRKVELYDELIG
ncbi:alpha carbonic anhydrase 1, chloroplastic-like [Durio zibethinus]|uniref:Carbonic anhydrase n=1 Tax=Durio zibethinus TaxID=66656 RepID=A0A6P5YTH6_DURZI|nr:alpha carbonic anhydrase 1, chloroplastic-like [Durio zibethinus]